MDFLHITPTLTLSSHMEIPTMVQMLVVMPLHSTVTSLLMRIYRSHILRIIIYILQIRSLQSIPTWNSQQNRPTLNINFYMELPTMVQILVVMPSHCRNFVQQLQVVLKDLNKFSLIQPQAYTTHKDGANHDMVVSQT